MRICVAVRCGISASTVGGNRFATPSIRKTWPRCSTLSFGMGAPPDGALYTAGGGPENAMSLRQLNAWCDARFGPHAPSSDPNPRPYDIPWIMMDNSAAASDFRWSPEITLDDNLRRIAEHAEEHPEWLERSGT